MKVNTTTILPIISLVKAASKKLLLFDLIFAFMFKILIFVDFSQLFVFFGEIGFRLCFIFGNEISFPSQ